MGYTSTMQSCSLSCFMTRCTRHIQEANPSSDQPAGAWQGSRGDLYCCSMYLYEMLHHLKRPTGNLISSKQERDGHDMLRLDGAPAHLPKVPSSGTFYCRTESLSNAVSRKINLSAVHTWPLCHHTKACKENHLLFLLRVCHS